MSEEDRKSLQAMKYELWQFSEEPLKWTSPKAAERTNALELIWGLASDMLSTTESGLRPQVEKLQLEVLKQISVLSEKRFKLLVKQLRESGGITRRVEAHIFAIRLRSKADRVLERIHTWIDEGEAERAKRTKSD